MQANDGTWIPCDADLTALLRRAVEDLDAGQPGAVTVRDATGAAHVLSAEARAALEFAVRAVDAGLRPDVGYEYNAVERYTGLAALMPGAMAELRRVFGIHLPRAEDRP
jgi:hypothetical protein